MLEADDYAGFSLACNNGQTEVMDKLRGWAKELGKEQEMLAARNHLGTQSACEKVQKGALPKISANSMQVDNLTNPKIGALGLFEDGATSKKRAAENKKQEVASNNQKPKFE